jgi:hypothetical protein
MKVTRVYTGADDESHFDEIEVEIEKLQPGEGIIFRHVPPVISMTGIERPDGSM